MSLGEGFSSESNTLKVRVVFYWPYGLSSLLIMNGRATCIDAKIEINL